MYDIIVLEKYFTNIYRYISGSEPMAIIILKYSGVSKSRELILHRVVTLYYGV